jgi:hypothetical protein
MWHPSAKPKKVVGKYEVKKFNIQLQKWKLYNDNISILI